MESQQGTWCSSKRFGFFRLPHELSRRALSDTTLCSVCELTYSGIWRVSRGHGVARNGSGFSGFLTNFHEGRCPTQHCALCVNSHTAVYGEPAGDMVLLETVRVFPAVTRTFTKRPQHNSVCVIKIQLSRDGLQATFIHTFILFQRPSKVDIELVIKINNMHITE